MPDGRSVVATRVSRVVTGGLIESKVGVALGDRQCLFRSYVRDVDDARPGMRLALVAAGWMLDTHGGGL